MPEREVYNYDTGQWEVVDDQFRDDRSRADQNSNPYVDPIGHIVPNAQPTPVVPPQTTAPPATTTPNGRHPNAGPDGSTEPNMDPPGYRGGYWMNGQWVNGERSGRGGGGFEGGPGGSGGPPMAANWPTYAAPDYLDPGQFDPGPAFTYKDFVHPNFERPSPESMLQEPGFQFRMDQGRKALEASAAGKGTLRSGGTLKDILQYGQNFASQEYGNVYNRALQEYDTNRNNQFGNYMTGRNNAFDTWQTGYGGRKDAFAFKSDNMNRQNLFNQGNSQFDFNARQQQAQSDLDEAFRRWQAEGNWTAGLAGD